MSKSKRMSWWDKAEVVNEHIDDFILTLKWKIKGWYLWFPVNRIRVMGDTISSINEQIGWAEYEANWMIKTDQKAPWWQSGVLSYQAEVNCINLLITYYNNNKYFFLPKKEYYSGDSKLMGFK